MQVPSGQDPILDAAYYEFTQDVLGALGPAMVAVRARSGGPPATPPLLLQLRRGYAESPGWFLVQALEFDPTPLTVARLRVRDIYASERIVAAILELMAGEQWLDRQQDAYSLAPAGRDLLNTMRDRQRDLTAGFRPLAAPEMDALEDLLARIIQACQEAAVPGAWCLAHSRNRAPGAEAVPLARIRQYLEDLNAFRDDAHMAAWQPHDVDGYVWEAFAHVCRGATATGAALFPLLAHRGYSQHDYAAALRDLAARGWLAPLADGAAYTVTAAGRAVHAAAERQTDRYFYAPWQILTATELNRLQALLQQLQTRSVAAAGA